MRYLITTNESTTPFFTDYFESENHFNSDIGMIVYDLANEKFTTDGTQWEVIPRDQL